MGCQQSTAQDIAAMEKKPGNVNEVVVFAPGLRIPKGTDFGKLLHASLSASMVEHLSALWTRIVVLATEEGLTVAKIKRKAATQHGGSTLADLLLALEDYLPVLPGLAKFGNQPNDLVEFSWINQEDDEKAAVSKLECIRSEIGVVSSPSASSSAREIQAPPPTSSVVDLSINEYDALVEKLLGRVLGAAKKIGGQVLEGTHLLKDANDHG